MRKLTRTTSASRYLFIHFFFSLAQDKKARERLHIQLDWSPAERKGSSETGLIYAWIRAYMFDGAICPKNRKIIGARGS